MAAGVCLRLTRDATAALALAYELSKKVRPSGDAGLVRPTYPELALGGTTLGAKDVNTGGCESDPRTAIIARAPAIIAPCRR